jgi:hypothetical protein
MTTSADILLAEYDTREPAKEGTMSAKKVAQKSAKRTTSSGKKVQGIHGRGTGLR